MGENFEYVVIAQLSPGYLCVIVIDVQHSQIARNLSWDIPSSVA
jgi:hypothetical protein